MWHFSTRIWIIWARCVSETLNLFTHINVYVVCPKERAILLSHKRDTTYNSTRHRGKSRPFYHSIKRKTNGFVSKAGDQVTFLIAQSSPRALQALAAQKNQPKQNSVLHLCLILPIKFHTVSHKNNYIARAWIFLIFSSDLHIFKSGFILWSIYRPMIFLIKEKKEERYLQIFLLCY